MPPTILVKRVWCSDFDPLAVVLFQMFKGPNEDIEAIFTAPVSAVCGVTLDANGKKEYLISGVCYLSDFMSVMKVMLRVSGVIVPLVNLLINW